MTVVNMFLQDKVTLGEQVTIFSTDDILESICKYNMLYGPLPFHRI